MPPLSAICSAPRKPIRFMREDPRDLDKDEATALLRKVPYIHPSSHQPQPPRMSYAAFEPSVRSLCTTFIDDLPRTNDNAVFQP
jgi:hypothetical protein